MKNLAGDKACDTDILEELKEAGIPAIEEGARYFEVPYHYVGRLGNWTFRRAWYFWMVDAENGKGLSEEVAEELNLSHMREVRVAGFSGGALVEDWLSKQGTIDSYHIDTQAGLNAFAAVLTADTEQAHGT